MASVIESLTQATQSISEYLDVSLWLVRRFTSFKLRCTVLIPFWLLRGLCSRFINEETFSSSNFNDFFYQFLFRNQSISVFVHLIVGFLERFSVIAAERLHDGGHKFSALSPVKHIVLVHVQGLECLNNCTSEVSFRYVSLCFHI